MEIKQVYEFVNTAVTEVLGDSALLQEDLTNIVDVGTAVFNTSQWFDKFSGKLLDVIGRTKFVIRKYTGFGYSVMMEAHEYGSIRRKISSKMPDATINEAWELKDGSSYDPNVFHKPEVSEKFYNKEVVYDIERSLTVDQVKSAFSSAGEMMSFVAMLENEVDKRKTVNDTILIQRTVNNMAAETLYAEYPSAAYTTKSGVKAVNLLKLFNDKFPSAKLKADVAIYNLEFIKFAAYQIKLYADRMRAISTRFNIGKQERFTNTEDLKVLMLADFVDAADVYLQSDTFHNEFTALPQADSVPYWQAPGEEYKFTDVSTINVKSSEGHSVNASGVLAMLFDREALGVSNINNKVTSNYNGKGDFTNYFHHFRAGYYNDFNEQFCLFFVA